MKICCDEDRVQQITLMLFCFDIHYTEDLQAVWLNDD